MGPFLKRRGSQQALACRQVIKDLASNAKEEAFVDDEDEDDNQAGLRKSVEGSDVSALRNSEETLDSSADPSADAGVVSEDGQGSVDKSTIEAISEEKPKRHPLTERIFFSHDLFWYPDQTVIIIDWDDTLFPTTWLEDDMQLDLEKPLQPLTGTTDEIRKPLRNVIKRARSLLMLASTLSKHTVIVTLAR